MQNNLFNLIILTSKRKKFTYQAKQINFRTNVGEITILANHTSIAGIVKKGNLLILDKDDKQIKLFHTDGAYSFISNELKIVVDMCDEKESNINVPVINKDKGIIIGDNEIIENHHFIENKFGIKEEVIEFEFKKIIKNIK